MTDRAAGGIRSCGQSWSRCRWPRFACLQGRYTRTERVSHATTPVLRGLAEVLDRLGDALVRDLKRARHGEAVGVHRARVASRRLRGGLGPVREIDVAREVLEGEARRRAWVDAAVGRVRRALERARQDYWNELADRLERIDEGRLGHRLTALATTLDRAPRRADSTARLAARLVRRARQ